MGSPSRTYQSTSEANLRCMGCMEPKGQSGSCPQCGWTNETDPSSVLHLPPATLLHNSYLVGRVLGQGGFGITYIGWDCQLQRKIAIKEYFPQMLASRQRGTQTVVASTSTVQPDFDYGLRTFLNEGRTLARFSDHPCIVSVFNLFEENRTAYVVMGYLEGETLAQTLARVGGRVPFQTACDIGMRVLDGLREVHAQGMLHRDISPDNIYLTRQGPVKILDFGAARQAVGERSQSLSVVLREGYAPEEQYRRSGNQGPWTDVYATAATLYRSITGITPPASIERLHQDTLQRPSELGVAIPQGAEVALLRALAVRAADRPQSVDAFQQSLLTEDPNSRPIPVAPSAKGGATVSAPSPREGVSANTALLVGLTIFIIAFFLPAVSEGANILTGYDCARFAIKAQDLVFFSGLINPLIVLYVMLRFPGKLARVRTFIALAILACIGITWYVLAKSKLHLEIGHAMWIAGILLIIARDLAALKPRQQAARPSPPVS